MALRAWSVNRVRWLAKKLHRVLLQGPGRIGEGGVVRVKPLLLDVRSLGFVRHFQNPSALPIGTDDDLHGDRVAGQPLAQGRDLNVWLVVFRLHRGLSAGA